MLMNLNERSLYIKQLYNTYIIHICYADNGNTHTNVNGIFCKYMQRSLSTISTNGKYVITR